MDGERRWSITYRAAVARWQRLVQAAAFYMVWVWLSVAVRASILGGTIFINEIHYDNAGRDVHEMIEVAIPEAWSTDSVLSRLRVTLYNGSSGRPYGRVIALTDFLWDAAQARDGYRFYYRLYGSVQNGAPDGMALSFDMDADGTFEQVQFLSYEGSFVATAGDAAGLMSSDIGVFESGATPPGLSLQLSGTGRRYEDFSWRMPQASTTGAVNRGQSFASRADVPEPRAGLVWWTLAVLVVCGRGYGRRRSATRWRC